MADIKIETYLKPESAPDFYTKQEIVEKIIEVTGTTVNAGDGIVVTPTKDSVTVGINISPDSESYLTVGPDGLKIVGITDEVNAVQELLIEQETQILNISTKVDELYDWKNLNQ